ncbi:MAG: hypothetical protein K8S97_11100 [Anaerolineae bacterium]|nr:hypothetical protein [Anaerolineae bacterium]
MTSPMTASKRLAARMRRAPVDRIPNMTLVMQYAADLIAAPLTDYYQDYNVLCEANFKCIEVYGLDLVDAISDPFREAADFGAQITFPDNDLPVCEALLIQTPTISKIYPRPIRSHPAAGCATGWMRSGCFTNVSAGRFRCRARSRARWLRPPICAG